MRHVMSFTAGLALAASPALAQPADPIEDDIQGALPPPEQIEAMAPALDRALGALLEVDVGPIIDAADPNRRRADHGRPGRTLGALGRRDDPYFEDRLRASVHGATADTARMMAAFAAMTPALARSLRELERAVEGAIDTYERGRGRPPGDK